MKRTLLVGTITATLAAAALAGYLTTDPFRALGTPSTEPVRAAAPQAGATVPTLENKNPAVSSGTTVADAGRAPVPISRAPNPPTTAEAPAPPLRSAERTGGDAPMAPQVPSSSSERAEPYAAPPAPPVDVDAPPSRITISRGDQNDYVVIPVDRHFVVIRGWRGGKEGKRERRHGD